jgi:hypothetical protein
LPEIANFKEWLQTGFNNPRRCFLTLAFTLAVYGPLLAAIIATCLETGKDSLVKLWRQIIRWRVDRGWYLSALAGQTMTLLGITFLYVWLYNHTRSLFVAILFHALSNTLAAIPFGEMQPVITLVIAISPWVVVAVLEKMLPNGRLAGFRSVQSN